MSSCCTPSSSQRGASSIVPASGALIQRVELLPRAVDTERARGNYEDSEEEEEGSEVMDEDEEHAEGEDDY